MVTSKLSRPKPLFSLWHGKGRLRFGINLALSSLNHHRRTAIKTKILALLVLTASSTLPVDAQVVFSNDFASGFTNGNLIGQNGWTQTGAATNVPLTVSGGTAVLPSGATGQDGWNPLSSLVATTNAGDYLLSTIVFTLTNAANATGDYFFHLSSPTNTVSNFFQRLYSRSNTTGFQLGVGAQSAPGAYGTTVLNLNTQYTAVIKWDFLAGASNDVMTLYINPTNLIITNNTPYSSTTWAVAEPTNLAAVNFRIGGSTTTPGLT